MIDPSRAQTVDTEITKYCAYNLPAVAYTLGRENWPCIKNLYETLAADMQVSFSCLPYKAMSSSYVFIF
jgi:serine/threonine-protein phosphatase 4 regulatory subunit 1